MNRLNSKKFQEPLLNDPIGGIHEQLLQNIKAKLPALEELLEEVNGHWVYEDLVYRFYHQSYKVYYIQDYSTKIVETLKSLAPEDCTFNQDFEKIYKEGTGKVFKNEHNKDWLLHTRPMVECFLHCKAFLEMAIKYGKELKKAPECLPSGWALLLYFYGLR